MKDVSGIFQARLISFGAESKIVRLRLKNHLAQNFLSFCAKRNERKLKDGLPIFHFIMYYMTNSWRAA